ncbi:MAG: hypothetical protein ACRDJE_14845 [Dehalococcoidia bacterium]
MCLTWQIVQRQVENTISKRLLAGEFAEGDTVRVDHTAHGYRFTKAEAATAVA